MALENCPTLRQGGQDFLFPHYSVNYWPCMAPKMGRKYNISPPDISEWSAQQFFRKESVSHWWPGHLETGWWVHWCEHGDLGWTPPTSSTRVVSILQILTSVCEIPSCAEEALAWTPREVTAVNVLLVISCPPTSQHVLVRRKTSDHLLVVSHSSHVSARVRSWWLDVCYSYFLHRHQRVWTECEPLS